MNRISRHLDAVGETYFQHMGHALGFAVHLFLASLACFIHALVPFWFEATGSRKITALYGRTINRRAGVENRNCAPEQPGAV